MNENEIIEKINTNGIVIIENFIKDVDESKSHFLSLFNKIRDKEEIVHNKKWSKHDTYSNGKAIRIYPEAYSNYPELVGIYQTPFFKSIADKYYNGAANFGMQYFMTHEYHVVDQSNLPRNAYLHFDPYQALKFIIYLTDTDKENGAFRYIPKTCGEGKELREKHCQTKKGKQNAYRIDYHKEISAKDIEYAEAPAGSLIIFDTDTFHGGGILKKEGAERMVLNFHCRKKEEKKQPFWSRLFK